MNRKCILLTVSLLTIIGLHMSFESDGLSQTDVLSPVATAGFKSGVITDVRGSTIYIDDRSYEIKSNVVVVDHEGEPLEVERIIPTSQVKFHLKEGHIDKMVVKLPQ